MTYAAFALKREGEAYYIVYSIACKFCKVGSYSVFPLNNNLRNHNL